MGGNKLPRDFQAYIDDRQNIISHPEQLKDTKLGVKLVHDFA
jgi:hypothetical protein